MTMMRRAGFILLSLLLVIAVSACGYKKSMQHSDSDYGSRKPGDPKMQGLKAYGSTNTDAGQHDNAFFEYSSMLSNKIGSLNGVANGIVMLTDKNAYVAILLDWSAAGTKAKGGTDEQNNTGSNGGVYNADSGSPYSNPYTIVTPYNSFFTVMDHQNLSNELKQTIAKGIREESPMIQEVHISANMEFNNYFVRFASEAWASRSLTPLVDTFNKVVQYEFDGAAERPAPITEPGHYSPQDWQLRKFNRR
ncbi:hypothetical protein [Paenibacillus sp. PAMC21692]|uniref:hypothetical protein n=1 Tax=Paenibacillus sp. PAMC21692 TaxID=2762320 RepID=UPI00164E6130|nr:hypothetical protein [Paenibacillus sp. PAMC21692]QNK59350.1 hypothetical protein H7F31_10965 [Paenibacillus sp. PAMC21692]